MERNALRRFEGSGNLLNFTGEGMKGRFSSSISGMIPRGYEIDSDAFYVPEQARDINHVLTPVYRPPGRWRQRHNRKQQVKD